MTLLPLTWTVLTVFLWTSGSCQILQQETSMVLYPAIFSSETLVCDCLSHSCQAVCWFRSMLSNNSVQFLVCFNNAHRSAYGVGVNESRFYPSKRGSMTFSLRINNVTDEDAGIYSCVLQNKREEDVWRPGVLLRPGVTPPTLPPVTKLRPPVIPVCRCNTKKNYPEHGCGSIVLWPLVGLIVSLAIALISTLYYFSRLPKKCRHHFVKRR